MTAARGVVAGSPMVACSYATTLFILALTLASVLSQEPVQFHAVKPCKTDEGFFKGLVFKPVDSCLASVTMVIYVQYLPLLERLDLYRDMYLPFFKDVEFYVDGTWCDPRLTENSVLPCTGEKLDRSLLPPEVHVVDGCGGGWLMQKAWIDAVKRHSDASNNLQSEEGGFLFMTDDVLLNLGQLTRFAREDGCGRIWQSLPTECTDVMNRHTPKEFLFKPDWYLSQSREFFRTSAQDFRHQIRSNLGSPSTYCVPFQCDFMYVPNHLAVEWAIVSKQMADVNLGFPFAVGTAIFGIVPNEDIAFLRTHYLRKRSRPPATLKGLRLESNDTCWSPEQESDRLTNKQRRAVDIFLSMHILHPFKISDPQTLDFALTMNRPQPDGLGDVLPQADSARGPELTAGRRQRNKPQGYPPVGERDDFSTDEDADFWAFWCKDNVR